MPERLLKPFEVAEALRVDVATVSRWCQSGLMRGVKLGPSLRSPLRIPESELHRALVGRLGAKDERA